MSSDEIFAAQMWTWPGPMMKRDAEGRVLVVNAAFLQMYGGRVEDWAGNAITGWPSPQAPGSATRFESRMPQADGSELIYDWVETTLHDGSALAIARDVTLYAQQVQQAPAAEPAFQETPPAESFGYEQPPQQRAASELYAERQETPMQQPDHHQQEALVAQPHTHVDEDASAMSNVQMPSDETFLTDNSYIEEKLEEAATAPEPERERDFERRALPIESGGSILGNNWRDAVIAKAVGAESAKMDEEEKQEEASTASKQSEKETGGKVRVLLAEDNAINALLTRTLLEAEGCIVEVVEDGSLAVEAVKNAPYDMIFMDMRMPNMDGLEATRKIRAMDHRSKGLPIVALTANAFDDDRNACFDSGMNDFMTKPVSAEELSEMVKIHTGNGKQKIAS